MGAGGGPRVNLRFLSAGGELEGNFCMQNGRFWPGGSNKTKIRGYLHAWTELWAEEHPKTGREQGGDPAAQGSENRFFSKYLGTSGEMMGDANGQK